MIIEEGCSTSTNFKRRFAGVIRGGYHMTPKHETNDSSAWLVASILISAVLLSAAIFYNGFAISTALSSGNYAGGDSIVVPQAPGGDPSAPAAPVKIELGDAPREGNKNAKVTVVEYSDFECPFCGRYYNDAYKQMKSEYIDTGKVQFVFKQYPLTQIHPNAQKAAEASLCAHEQGKFFAYHDTLFANQQSLGLTALKQYAADNSLDTSKFNSCLDSGKYAKQVQDEVSEGSSVGVSGTPTTFVNGVKIVGAVPYATIKAEIDSALAAN